MLDVDKFLKKLDDTEEKLKSLGTRTPLGVILPRAILDVYEQKYPKDCKITEGDFMGNKKKTMYMIAQENETLTEIVANNVLGMTLEEAEKHLKDYDDYYFLVKISIEKADK